MKDYDLVVWSGIIVPAATPTAVIEQLNGAVNRALQTREVREKLTQRGLEIVGGRSQDFAQLISRESRKWADVARRANIRPD